VLYAVAMPQVTILGGGMVGSVMAADMASEPGWSVRVVDASAVNLERTRQKCREVGRDCETVQADLTDPRHIARHVEGADLVLGALASRIALSALRSVLECGRPCCDISFMSEDPLALDGVARAHGATAVVDCGVAPGMSHILATYAASQLDRCESIVILVGGLPRERRWPFQYKAAFSPADVIEEYTRPVRLVRDGRVEIVEALSEPELVEFEGLGTLEAFNTDGLRSLVTTHGPGSSRAIPGMVEKTLRYPGHIELMRTLRAMGLFSEIPTRVGTQFVVPREVTAALMFPMWTYRPGEEDLTVMRVEARGVREGRPVSIVYDLLDWYHRPSGSTSMARCTALPCTIVGRLLAAGRITGPGIVAPEMLGYDQGIVGHLLEQLHARGIIYRRRVVQHDAPTR
jgi:lysine 6-dehydrogenase